jgi:L-cysteine/cystine lyase
VPGGYDRGVPPDDLGAVRARLPCLAARAHLNTGGTGPLPDLAVAAAGAWARRALERGRGDGEWFAAVEAEAARTRAAAGRVIGAAPGEIALTANTTAGANIVAWGIDWRPGDEIVMPALEHPGLAVPLATVARRHGVRLRLVDHDGMGRRLAEEVADACGPRTRLVALSHVSWATGAVLDVAGAARAARGAKALVLVDGAQAAGAIPVDPAALGADAYALPAHKWLLGPGGLGALWISPAALARIDLTHAGFESGTGHRPGGGIDPHPAVRRHEVSTLPDGLLGAWRASIEWLEALGWGWVHARVATAREAARAALAGVPGVRVLTPPAPCAGLLTFTIAGADPERACAALAGRGILVRWLQHPAALRVSTGFFTDDADIARLAAGVASVAAGTAASLP